MITVEKVVVPDITFPIFPLAESMSRNGNGTTSVPDEWIVRLEEFRIRYKSTEDFYDGLREIYEKFYGKKDEKN